jgi:ATP-dependent DNA helicase RecG
MESQTIEWKEAWHDEHMRTICAFANATGGVLEIGRLDDGEVIGVSGIKKLLEDLPNKIKNAMAIVADVDTRESNGKQYIAVTVRDYPFPISYHGVYYVRSGSTTQELTGSALDEFMLRKQGRTWDGVPTPYVEFADFESDAFKAFRRKAIESTRLAAHDLEISDEKLLDTLQLIEGKYIKRAAILLFHQDPEKWVPGAYIKIGMFENDADLRYQHEIHGPLITMPDKVMETVYLNYFKGIISYRGIQRIETYPVPHAAFREAITNAIVHRDYSSGIPIQIKVFPDRVIIYNDGRLPQGWTIEDLKTTHRSQPHNPLIAGAFFRSGQIESWGRGIEKIAEACNFWGKPKPEIDFKYSHEFSMTFPFDVNIVIDGIPESIGKDTVKDTVRTPKDTVKDTVKTPKDTVKDTVKTPKDTVKDTVRTPKDTVKDTVNAEKDTQVIILRLLSDNPQITVEAISAELGINERNVKKNIKTLKDTGQIERAGSDKRGYWVVKSSENSVIKDTVNHTQNIILKLLIANPQITTAAISAELGINERNVKKNIKTLKDIGRIEHSGSDRSGYWVVKDIQE